MFSKTKAVILSFSPLGMAKLFHYRPDSFASQEVACQREEVNYEKKVCVYSGLSYNPEFF